MPVTAIELRTKQKAARGLAHSKTLRVIPDARKSEGFGVRQFSGALAAVGQSMDAAFQAGGTFQRRTPIENGASVFSVVARLATFPELITSRTPNQVEL
jgi:hypothetical protein